MPTLSVYNQEGAVVGTVELSANVFGQKPDTALVHEVVVAQRANARHPISNTKTKGEVRGGGIKPWRQKGTGRSRHGSIRSPIWKGGGASHGPVKGRNYAQKVNKKMARAALYSVLSKKLSAGELKFVSAVPTGKGKTKEVFSALKGFFAAKRQLPSTLLVSPVKNGALVRAARNIDRVQVLAGASLNIVDVVNARNILVEQAAVTEIK
jgi:large subunit ribosomal protein L4